MQGIRVALCAVLLLGAIYTGWKSGVVRFRRDASQVTTRAEIEQRRWKYCGFAIVAIACLTGLYLVHHNPKSPVLVLMAVGVVCVGFVMQQVMQRIAARIDADRQDD